jgi:hypothetical protein
LPATRVSLATSHSSTGCGGRDFFGIERWQAVDRSRLLQRQADGVFLRRFVGLQLRGVDAAGEMGGDEALVARPQAGVSRQRRLAGELVADEPGLARRNVAGGERGQPEVEVAIERFLREGGDFRWQAQGFGIAPGMGDLFAAAGDALQPAAPRPVGFGGGSRHVEAGVAAEGAEQDAGGFLDLGQFDGGLRIMAAGRPGDPVVPELADELFHVRPFPRHLRRHSTGPRSVLRCAGHRRWRPSATAGRPGCCG